MKKKPYFFLSTALVSIVIIFFIQIKKYNYIKKRGKSIILNENLSERIQWEIKRLADPSTGKIPAHIREKELAFASILPKDIEQSILSKRDINLNWEQRGPWNVGGRTRAIAFDVNNENIIIAGSVSGGIWRSSDGGIKWKVVSTPDQTLGITSIAQDKRAGKTNVWYAGTGEYSGTSASASYAYYLGDGIYKSVDSGKTWALLPSTTHNTPQGWNSNDYFDFAWRIATTPNDTIDEIFAATAYFGIFRSKDGGNTWTVAKGGGSYYCDVAVSPNGIIYAVLSSDGSQKGIWRSSDGNTWTNITPSNFPSTYRRIVIGISQQDENKVYFLGVTPGSGKLNFNYQRDSVWSSLWKYNYLSGSGAGSEGAWTDFSKNLPDKEPFDQFDSQGGYDLAVRAHPVDSNILFIAGTNIFRSTNQFKDTTHTKKIGGYKVGLVFPTQDFSYPNHHSDQHDMIFLPSNPNVLFSASDGGIAKTLNCLATTVDWVSLNNGYNSSQFYTISLDHGTPGSNIIAGGLQDNGTLWINSTFIEKPWIHVWGGDGSHLAIADGADYYYFSTQLAKTYKVQLDNNTGAAIAWTRIDPMAGPIDKSGDFQFINPFVMDPNDNNILYIIGNRKIWRNHDVSQIPLDGTWNMKTTNWVTLPDTVSAMEISTLAVSTIPANVLYYGTSNRKIYRVDSANTGYPLRKDISPTTSPYFPGGAYINCIAIDPRDANKVMVVFSNYSVYSLFYTSDGGTTWRRVAGNLEQNQNGSGNGPSCRWASIMPMDNGTLYLVGTSTGLYATDTLYGGITSDSTKWVQQGTNTIGNAIIDMMDFRISDKAIVIGTHGNGVFSANMPTNPGTGGLLLKNKNIFFNLKNFPNPFSENTTIQFSLIKNIKVRLNVYDIAGNKIMDLCNKELSEGTYSISFNAKSLSSGIYFCNLIAGNERETIKMIVNK